MSEVRVLLISHGHPDFSLGGGEIAAHAQWLELRRRGITAMFLARSNEFAGHMGAPFSARSLDGLEVLFSVPPVHHFRHSQPQGRVVFESFRHLLEAFRPTAIHFHHYVHLGLEFIREARKYGANASITVTLHEFLAICHAQGQMLKTNGMLCRKAAPLDCHACFPDISPQDFFMRELFVKSFFELVDYFVCPSAFLRDRYVAWGLPPEKIIVLDNGQPPSPAQFDAPEENIERRFVLLGQLSRLKGTLVLLDAIRLLPRPVRQQIRVELHGSVQYALDDFKQEFAKGMEGLEDVVRLCGPYMREHLTGILRRNGWLIVPSIWWENSPMVIQEAFAAGRPVICSDVGGMAEKVVHGMNGFHFRVNNAADLAARMECCAAKPELFNSIRENIPIPLTISQAVDSLIKLYAKRNNVSLSAAYS
jgi:glycosyltransferase involved in cell wall biosynthesis